MKWKDSIWFFDLDDTLINTSEVTEVATQHIPEVLTKYVGEEKAAQIHRNFLDIFSTLMNGHWRHDAAAWEPVPEMKKKHDEIVEKIWNHQREIIEQYGTGKKWSREVVTKLAADQAEVDLSPQAISEAIDAYWSTLAEKTIVYDGASPLFAELQKRQRPVFIVTGSDAHLQLKDNGQFAYDPAYSEEFKMKRIRPLQEKGIYYHGVAIGDPIDKPHRAFFEKAVQLAEKEMGETLNPQRIVMVGDSYHADLKVPKEELDFGLVVQFEKGREAMEKVDERHIIVGNLSEITAAIDH